MKILLQRWQERSLTLIGKVTIIKSLALPIIAYSASNCETPPWVIKNVNSLFFNFLWNGSEKVKRRAIIGKIDQGGINMIDVEGYFHALKASWVKRLSQAHMSQSWFYSPCWYFKELHIWQTIYDMNCKNITEIAIFKGLPGFYKEIVQSFIECNHVKDVDFNGCIRELCIWGNKAIVKEQNQSLYFPRWIECGIIRVSDIRFISNRINEQDILSRLQKKTNYISEMYQIKHAINTLSKTAPRCIQNTCEHKASDPKKTKQQNSYMNAIYRTNLKVQLA